MAAAGKYMRARTWLLYHSMVRFLVALPLTFFLSAARLPET